MNRHFTQEDRIPPNRPPAAGRILGLLVLATLVAAGAAWPRGSSSATPGAIDRQLLLEQIARWDTRAVRAHGREVLPVLVELYRQGDTAQRTHVANAFYALGWPSEEAKEVLLEGARSRDQALRIAAQYALGRVSDDPVVVDLLVENLLEGFNPLVRDKAACSLAYDQIHLTERQKVRLFARMIELLESPSPETRSLAIRVLQVHTGQLKGFIPAMPEAHRARGVERWKRWLEEYEAQLEGGPQQAVAGQ